VRRVLLLNVTYEPLTTVGLRRAVCLVLGGKGPTSCTMIRRALCCAQRRSCSPCPRSSGCAVTSGCRTGAGSRSPVARSCAGTTISAPIAATGPRPSTMSCREAGAARTRGKNCVASCMRWQSQQERPVGRGTWLDTALRSRRAARAALAPDRGHVRRRPAVGRLPGRAERCLTRQFQVSPSHDPGTGRRLMDRTRLRLRAAAQGQDGGPDECRTPVPRLRWRKAPVPGRSVLRAVGGRLPLLLDLAEVPDGQRDGPGDYEHPDDHEPGLVDVEAREERPEGAAEVGVLRD